MGSMTWTPTDDAAFRQAAGDNVPSSAAAIALAEARVDLIDMIRNGIPPRQYVPGCEPWLIRGKRYLIPASAGSGKSLAALVIAVEIVEHGGTVVILDVENGAEEYASRLNDILTDRTEDVVQACSERLRYYAWPALRAEWGADDWAAALNGVDVVGFDSSRFVLSGMGLAEDSNDDYSTFANAMLIPLSRAGTTTIVLDNTGWEGDHARGASAKHDLNEVVYLAKVGKPFDRDQTGELHLDRKRSRFADLPARLTLTLGGETYRAPIVADGEGGAFKPTGYMEKISKQIEASPGLGREEVLSLVGGKRNFASAALTQLVNEGYVRTEPDGHAKRHHSVREYREHDDA